jgi:methionyl aminopeptidase
MRRGCASTLSAPDATSFAVVFWRKQVPQVEIMSAQSLEKMRASCALAAECLVHVGPKIRAGLSTDEIDRIVHEFIVSRDAYPSPLNYRPSGATRPYPKSVCTSVNEVVCHGIPGKQVLRDGDIVNVDVTTYHQGFHGDTSVTFYVGEPSDAAKRLVETSRECLEAALAEVKDGARLGNIGAAIQELAEGRGFTVVEDYVGHGVGREFHMPPQVRHFGKRGAGERIHAGMVFTIEPMINLGTKGTELTDDDWTVVTEDRSLSAQFEHTVLVTKTGCEVLTSRPAVVVNSEDKPWSKPGPLGSRSAWEKRT